MHICLFICFSGFLKVKVQKALENMSYPFLAQFRKRLPTYQGGSKLLKSRGAQHLRAVERGKIGVQFFSFLQ